MSRCQHNFVSGDVPSSDDVVGPYPTVVEQPDGGQGLVLQAFHNGKYLGVFNVTFDDAGVITKYAGDPVLLDHTIPEGKSVDGYSMKIKNLHGANFTLPSLMTPHFLVVTAYGATTNDKVGMIATFGSQCFRGSMFCLCQLIINGSVKNTLSLTIILQTFFEKWYATFHGGAHIFDHHGGIQKLPRTMKNYRNG